MTNNQKKIGIGIVIAVLCALAFYFLYWVKSPVYSLNIIKDSIQKHDVNTFEKHVDMDTLYTKAFDDSLVAIGKINGEDLLSNPLAAGFIQILKPPVVSTLKSKTIDYVKGEKEEAKSNKDKNSQAEDMANGLKDRAGIENLNIKDISVISKENNESIVAITLFHRKVSKNFDLKVKMSKLDDGTWKLKEITNLVDFLVEIDKAEKAKLVELDKPIKGQIYKALKPANKIRGGVRNEGRYFPDWALVAGFKVNNISNKNIKNSKAYINIKRVSDKKTVKTSPLIESGSIAKGAEHEYYTHIKLNEFKDEDKEIIQAKNNELTLSIKIMSIEFEDGTSIVRPTKLPD